MKTTPREVKRRKASLKASGHTYDDLARLAGVSWRMVKFWLQSRMGDTEAREKARELVDQARKWLDEYEAGLEGD